MPQGMRVQPFLDARSLGGIPAGMPNHFRVIGLSLVWFRLPGNSHSLGLRLNRRQSSRNSLSSVGLNIRTRSYCRKSYVPELRSISKRHRLLRIAFMSRCVDDSA